ncbi:hypothetical protein ACJJTC_018962 [Scirpophaga incertulas]
MGSHKKHKAKKERKLRRELLTEMETRRLMKRVASLENLIMENGLPTHSKTGKDEGVLTPPLPREIPVEPCCVEPPSSIASAGVDTQLTSGPTLLAMNNTEPVLPCADPLPAGPAAVIVPTSHHSTLPAMSAAVGASAVPSVSGAPYQASTATLL